MRVSKSVLLVLILGLSLACDKKGEGTKTGSDEQGAALSGPLGADESKCRTACEKGPRFHFEEALKAELRRNPEAEHQRIKTGAEERWIAMKAKHEGRVNDCVAQCTKMAKPGEVDCLIEAKDMAETQACIRKFKSRPKGATPESSSTTRSKESQVPGAIKQPKAPKDPKAPGVKTPTSPQPEPTGLPKPGGPGAPTIKLPSAKPTPTAADPTKPAAKAPADVPAAAKPAPVASPDGKKTR